MKKVNSMIIKAKNAMAAKKGEAYVDTVVKIVIVAVLGVVVFIAVKAMVNGLMGSAEAQIDNLSGEIS